MARIVGVCSRSDVPAELVVAGMLRAIRPAVDWRQVVRTLDEASVGTTGRRPADVFRSNEFLVIVDGFVYNAPADSPGAAALVAARYIERGFVGAVQALEGDFAIALFDRRARAWWLARDRFGVRPLYYVAGERFAFASRPASLLALAEVAVDVNPRYVALVAASHYRYFDNVPGESPYRAIGQLPAAHVLRAADGRVEISRYWSLDDRADYDEPEAVLAERCRELLLDAVRRRLALACRPAFTLSGGMDSSSVLSCARHVTGAKQAAFSVVYDDRTYDESDDIRVALDATVDDWHPCRIGTPDVFDLVSRMIDVHDEPVATATWLSHFRLCEQAARAGFEGLFGGLGGDELNAGEYEHFLYHFADLKLAGPPEELAHEIQRWIVHHDHPVFRKSPALVEANLARFVDATRAGVCKPDRDRLLRYAAALNPDYFDLAAFEPVMDHPFASYLKNRAYQDLVRETAPCCLRAEDRQAEAFGLDHFLPFLDHKLVEFMFRVPGRLKIRDGVTKRLLREAMRGILPEVVRTRVKKTGWNAPAHLWFTGPGRAALLDLVHGRAFRERGIYNVAEVERIIDEHQRIVASGKPHENHMMFLWQVTNVELWHRSLAQRSPKCTASADALAKESLNQSSTSHDVSPRYKGGFIGRSV